MFMLLLTVLILLLKTLLVGVVRVVDGGTIFTNKFSVKLCKLILPNCFLMFRGPEPKKSKPEASKVNKIYWFSEMCRTLYS